ncbi:MAG TPA: 50S ribosomal protein L4 [Myxococcales bacterium]|jgi:large subunit ribosomal protein L4|nr:50S ribosomal protein L4 [Myxococcales bacterium]
MAKFDVYNLEKQKVGTVDLADDVFAAEVNPHLLYEAVKAQQASRRSGTVAVKNRGLVSGGGKKPWKQKGTGRARQGSIRASHWVGGGKAMGPKPRDYAYRPPLKVRKGALCSALSLRAKEGQLWILDAFELPEIKTKRAAAVFAKLGLGKALVVELKANQKLHRSVRNLAHFDALPPEGLNVEDVLRHPALVLTQGAAKAVEARLA